jgi:hypothetical protein
MSDGRGQQLTDEIAAAARASAPTAPDYLDRIRRATARLAVRDGPPDDARMALLAVVDHTHIDVDVPTGSRRRGARLFKLSVKRLTGWYLRYLGQQVTLLGQAIVRFGTALTERTERLEEVARSLQDEVGSLKSRVDRLEGLDREPPRQ